MEIDTNTNNNKKTIQINPDLFKISSASSTRKNRSSDKIRIKNTHEKPKKMSTIKRNILKMIRNHQDERRRKKIIDDDNPIITPSTSVSQQFHNEFNESLEYLSNLTKDVNNKKQSCTIKRYPSSTPMPMAVAMPIQAVTPKYGCLKNGKLPTYRNWINQTRKNIPTYQSHQQIQIPMQQQIQIPMQQQIQPQMQQQQIIIQNSEKEKEMKNNLKKLSKIEQFERRLSEKDVCKRWKHPKQKKIIRRTYYVGRSKVHPRVSVLVSNKTIRARTTLKQQELKQVPIAEVKKYLLKHGFIKVGTSSPSYILREMYENAQLICGEIKNHNPENLLYNYFNASSSE
jgi:hypothetical protein